MERFRIVCASIWVAVQLIWLQRDVLIRDGDEEGHVGAAELVAEQIHSDGWFSFITNTWWQDLGEYPPIFASYMGAWWYTFAVQPEDIMFRIAGIPLILCTAWAVSETSRLRNGDENFAFALVLCLPLATGLSRHSMIENMILPCTALCVWSLTKKHHPRTQGLLFGLFFCLGMLAKQTFLIVGIGTIFLVHDRRVLYTAFPMIFVGCFGWYFPQFTKQQSYIMNSVGANTNSSTLIHIITPIAFLLWDLLGPVISAFVLYVLCVKKNRDRNLLLWFTLSIFLFVLIPKKYPRLMIGLCIPIILLCAEQRSARNHLTLILAFLWMVLGSWISIPRNPIHAHIDKERCAQIWLRPPFPYDLGLRRIASHIQNYPNDTSIQLVSTPKIPCTLQTTHDFAYHLEIYLRRHGMEHPIDTQGTSTKNVRISWSGDILHPSSLIIQ